MFHAPAFLVLVCNLRKGLGNPTVAAHTLRIWLWQMLIGAEQCNHQRPPSPHQSSSHHLIVA
eukprot:378947-Karenia_brevis.AAC.1